MSRSFTIISSYRGKCSTFAFCESALSASEAMKSGALKPSLWLDGVNGGLKDIAIIAGREEKRDENCGV